MFTGTRKLQQNQQQQSMSPQLSSRNTGRNSHNNKNHNNGKKLFRPKRRGSTNDDETNNINQQPLIVQPINLEGQRQQLPPPLDPNYSNLGYLDQDGKFVSLFSGATRDHPPLPLTNVIGNGNNFGSSQNFPGINIAQQSGVQMQQVANPQKSMQTPIASSMLLPEGSVVNKNGQLLYVLPNQQLSNQALSATEGTMGIPMRDIRTPEVNILENNQLKAVSTDQDIQAAAANTAFMAQNPQLILNNNLAAAAGTNNSYDNNIIIQPRPATSSSTRENKVLYYDPLAATINGQLHVPQTVYDADGKEVDLTQLQSSTTEIYIEPPSSTQQQQQSLPAQKLSRIDRQYSSETTAQDQSIIVATVAVMALLVGALSARKLRSRNFISSCIENESLEEDEVAYDVSTTAGDYSTFGAGNWKGDLEKFDV